jgi:DNA repair exonuclease SbcCD ATPase subunit
MITLKNLEWSNVFSYGKDNKLILDKDPIVQLVGKNGHGKSSIGLILEELFYNKNSKGIKRSDIINRHSKESKYSISGDFEKDGDTYRIETTRGSSQSIKFTKNDVDISSHTATGTLKLIEEVLGLDSNSFAQLIYQSSASSLEFLTATDTNRKKFLINLLNLEEYTNAHDVFKGLVKDTGMVVAGLEVKIDTVNSWIKSNEKFDAVKKDLVEVDSPIDSSDISNLTASLKTIDATNKRITQNNQYIALQAKIPLEQLSIVLPEVADITAERNESVEIKKSIKDAKAFIAKMGKISDNCPTCSQPVDNSKSKQLVAEQEELITVAEARAIQLEDIISKVEADAALVNKILGYKTEYENYNSLIDPTMSKVLSDKDEIALEIEALQQKVDDCAQAIKEQEAYNAKVIAHNAKVDVISEQMAEHTITLVQHQLELDKVTKDLSILQLLQKTFSTNGLVAYKIECMVKDLQNLTNQYLGELSDGRFQISFQVSSSDKLNVVIIDNGTEIDILALSSGERARVNTATLLAIRKLMQTLSSVRINILILDETIDNLDIDGKEKLVEVLLKEEYLNTILVSHGYSHPLIEKISVIKENNISRIE